MQPLTEQEKYQACIDSFMFYLEHHHELNDFSSALIRNFVDQMYDLYGLKSGNAVQAICTVIPDLTEETASLYLPAYGDCRDWNEATLPITMDVIGKAWRVIEYNPNPDGTGYACLKDSRLETQAGHIPVYTKEDIQEYLRFCRPCDGSLGFEFMETDELNERLCLELENMRINHDPAWTVWKNALLYAKDQ